MNIWHDMDPRRVTPENFLLLSRLKRAEKTSMSLIKKLDF